ncbi:MAG TPA: hypothetical protein VGA98_00955, partial [Allosphingosinicella sp.]
MLWKFGAWHRILFDGQIGARHDLQVVDLKGRRGSGRLARQQLLGGARHPVGLDMGDRGDEL